MSSVTSISSVSTNVRQRVTPEEWEVRVKLAAAYRLAALYKWTDHIYTPQLTPTQVQTKGGPYLPQAAVLGGRPTVDLDVPICTVFLVLFIAGATFNMTIFQINRRHGYKFLFSGLLFGFCMARIVALSTRIVWATRPHNISVAIASQIFTAAGVILLFITNLVFAQRIIRAYHPFFGWSKPVSIFFSVLYFSVVAILIMVITATVHSFFTLDPTAAVKI